MGLQGKGEKKVQRQKKSGCVHRWNPLRVRKGRKDMIYFRESEFSTIKGDKRAIQREQACFSIAHTQNGETGENESF